MYDWYGDFVINVFVMIWYYGFSYDVINSYYWDVGVLGQKIVEELQIFYIYMLYLFGWWKQNDM